MWWENAVVYQVYVRSFQDSNGDGVGDLPGATRRLDHIAALGVDAVWLSPVYPSPNHDYGYDVADFQAVDPALGTLEDLDALIARAHELGLRLVLDFVPCHTSIHHPWFRQHPDYYVWADAPANNWRAAFGDSAWALDPQTGRYYLHSFFPEQADLNWHNPDVRSEMASALRFWIERGVDGFRLDALDRLMKDEQLRDDPPAAGPSLLPMDADDAALEHRHSRNAPDIGVALRAIRDAAGAALLIGEVYLPTTELGPYLDELDVVFNFETLHAGADPSRLRAAIAAGLQAGNGGWVLSNHDFSRLAIRYGSLNARAVLLLLLSLPGPTFVFQGDELGMADATPADPPQDRYGRDGFRMPMRWDQSAHGGFTTGAPWLRSREPPAPSAGEQEGDSGSVLHLARAAIGLRQRFHGPMTLLPSTAGTIALQRVTQVIAINLGDVDQPAPPASVLELEARPGDGADLGVIPSHGGWIARRTP